MSLADLIRDLSESLQPPENKPRTHGCYYVVEGEDPERCVLEYGRPQDCVFATRLVAEGKDQTTCQYWRPLREQAAAARPTESRPTASRPTASRPVERYEPTRKEADYRRSDQRGSERPTVSATPREPEPAVAAPISSQTITERLQDREALIVAVITREILDKPMALRRHRR